MRRNANTTYARKAQYSDFGQCYWLFLLVTKVFPREVGARLAAQDGTANDQSLPSSSERLPHLPLPPIHTLRDTRIRLPGVTELLPSQRPPRVLGKDGPQPPWRASDMRASQTARDLRITGTLIPNTESAAPPTKSGSERVGPRNLNFSQRRSTPQAPS